MKNAKILFMVLMSMNYSAIKANNDDDSNFNNKIKEIANKLHKSIYRTADWFEHYRSACVHNLADWIEHCRNVAKNDTEAFTSFIIDEKDAAFLKLSKAEQKAVRDINQFYKDMASTSRKKQDELVRNFSKRWKECQRIFHKTAHKTAEQTQTLKNEIDEFTKKLKNSARSSADWAEYYARACTHDLSEWVEYHRNLAQNDTNLFKDFIQNEESATFYNFSKAKQQAIKDLNNFYREMASANKEKQDEIVQNFSTRWAECQEIFNQND